MTFSSESGIFSPATRDPKQRSVLKMNMKEAFRFQNKLDAILSEAEDILKIDRNVMKQKSHYLHSKVISA
jgi:hypothetical protein